MLINTKNNLAVVFITLFLSSFLSACNKPSISIAEKSSDHINESIAHEFNQGQNLFNQGKVEQAFKIYKKLAENGDAQSQNALGNGYQYGFWGDIDLEKANYWYSKAANQNYAGAIHNLGMLSFLQKDYKKALPSFEKAAQMENPDAINMLGVYYSEGILFKQDYKKAIQYFDQATDINPNNSSAQFNIGQAYYYGEGVDQDYKKAFSWLTKSANQNYSLAKIQLAEMYFSGKGIKRDVTKAIEIIKPLANLGDAKAQENLKWYIEHPNEY